MVHVYCVLYILQITNCCLLLSALLQNCTGTRTQQESRFRSTQDTILYDVTNEFTCVIYTPYILIYLKMPINMILFFDVTELYMNQK